MCVFINLLNAQQCFTSTTNSGSGGVISDAEKMEKMCKIYNEAYLVKRKNRKNQFR